MSTVVIGAGGPHPNARIVSVYEEEGTLSSVEIRDGEEVLLRCAKLSHARALLPLIQSGE